MGGIDSWFDKLDEEKVSLDGYVRPETSTGSFHGNHKSPRSFTIFVFHIVIFFVVFIDSSLR
jgi:hypothetical protein